METTPGREQQIKELLRGTIDPHIHSGPSIAPRGLDHIELLKEAADAGMAAVVTKDHDYSGVATANLIASHYGHLPTKLYSGIVLNNVVGGFNPYAVEHTAAMGGKIVWLPTLAAENHLAWEKKSSWAHPASTKKMRPATAVPATRDGKVLDEVRRSSTSSPGTTWCLPPAICTSARSGWCSRRPRSAARRDWSSIIPKRSSMRR
jgi:hypothetical protein